MATALGADCHLLILPEIAGGKAPASNWQRMAFLSCHLGAAPPLLDADVVAIGRKRKPTALFRDTAAVAG